MPSFSEKLLSILTPRWIIIRLSFSISHVEKISVTQTKLPWIQIQPENDVGQQLQFINQRPCFAAIHSFTAVHVNGVNAAKFLQGQLTGDILTLSPRSATLSACCDQKGRMIANFWVGRIEDDYFLFMPRSMSAQLIAHLQKYAVFSKVILNEQNDWAIFNYCGQQLPNFKTDNFIHTQLAVLTQNTQLHWFIGKPELMIEVWKCLQNFATEICEEAIQYAWILAHLVFLQPTTMNLFLPQMLELEKLGGVSFNKGCYVGQEVVARTQHLGQLKRHLQKMHVDSTQAPLVGEALHDGQGQQVGHVAAVSLDPKPGYLLLCVIQDHALNSTIFINKPAHYPLSRPGEG